MVQIHIYPQISNIFFKTITTHLDQVLKGFYLFLQIQNKKEIKSFAYKVFNKIINSKKFSPCFFFDQLLAIHTLPWLFPKKHFGNHYFS